MPACRHGIGSSRLQSSIATLHNPPAFTIFAFSGASNSLDPRNLLLPIQIQNLIYELDSESLVEIGSTNLPVWSIHRVNEP